MKKIKCKKILAYKVLSDETLKSETKADLIERIRILEHNWSCAEESFNNSVKNSEKIFADQKAEIERLTGELEKQVDELTEKSERYYNANLNSGRSCYAIGYYVGQKDTAKEILQMIKEGYGYIGNLEKRISERYDVEVNDENT